MVPLNLISLIYTVFNVVVKTGRNVHDGCNEGLFIVCRMSLEVS